MSEAMDNQKTVVITDNKGTRYQGKILRSEDKRFFSKTANIKLGEYRNREDIWRPTSKNGKARPDNLNRKKNYNNMVKESLSLRVCYSHEYMGE